MSGKVEMLEERLKAMEGTNIFGNVDPTQLCLVTGVVIPPNFNVPELNLKAISLYIVGKYQHILKMVSCLYIISKIV